MRSRQAGNGLEAVSVYIPKALRNKIEVIAKKEHRSLSAEIVVLLERAMEKPAGK